MKNNCRIPPREVIQSLNYGGKKLYPVPLVFLGNRVSYFYLNNSSLRSEIR